MRSPPLSCCMLQAEEAFKELRLLEPHQVQGMETYSTVLFHLQKEVALSTLAQDMVDIDKSCAQVYCICLAFGRNIYSTASQSTCGCCT